MSVITKDLGAATAYAYAVEKGYTGTEAEFAELMADYANVGQRAENAADSALESKSAAQTAAQTATNKASEATQAAQTAATKAAEAKTDADAAALDARRAMSAASTATSKATEATTAAATAVSSKDAAVSANTAAQSAKTAAQTAQQGAETARDAVQSSAAQITTNTEDITQLKEDLNALDNRTDNLESELLTPVFNDNAENITINDGHFVKYSTPEASDNGTYNAWGNTKMSQAINVQGVKQIKVSSYAYPNVPVVTFFISETLGNANFISAALTSQSGWHAYNDEVVDVPDGAKYAYINGRSGDAYPITLYLSTLQNPAKYDGQLFEMSYCYGILREDEKNPFAWKTLDKTCFSVRIDDLLSDVDLAVKIATDNGVPVSIACDVSKLNDAVNGIVATADKIGNTRKDVLNYCVANGGEVLLHPSETIGDTTWKKFLVADKVKLLDYNVRGCAVANRMPSTALLETMSPYIHGYYDYSDGYGSGSAYSYDFPEGFTIRRVINLEAFPTIDALKAFFDDKIGRNNHYTLIFHSITGVGSNGVSTEYYTQAIQYLKTLANNSSVKLTTWRDVYKTYGTSEFAKRISALE